jgi:hypothetical protein
MLSVQYKLAFLTQNQMMIVCVDLAAVGFILTVEFNICFVLRLPSTLMVPMNASKSYAYHDVSLYSVWN